MSAPDLLVIDRAIERIRLGLNRYTCYALERAAFEVAPQDWTHADAYVNQYQRWTLRNGKEPKWWDSGRRYKRERIAALKSFRQACIDAASKQCNA